MAGCHSDLVFASGFHLVHICILNLQFTGISQFKRTNRHEKYLISLSELSQ